MNHTNIKIDPRLYEYIEKKKFNTKHNVSPDIPLEKQYQITKDDMKVIRDYMQNNTNTNQDYRQNHNNYSDMIEIKKQRFISEHEQYDERLERIQEKMKRERDANLQRNQMGNLNYDMFKRNFSSALGNDINDEFNLNSIENGINSINQIDEVNSNSNRYYNYSQKTHITPKIMYNQPVHYNQRINDNSDQMTNIIGNVNNYKNKINRTYDYNSDSTGLINSPINPSECRKELLENLYQGVHLAQGSEGYNSKSFSSVDVENYVKYGVPTSKAKSLGFENPVEHFFQYIDDDIQKPEHVLFDRPVETRLENKNYVQPKSREIY
jgi:hypothetical protein